MIQLKYLTAIPSFPEVLESIVLVVLISRLLGATFSSSLPQINQEMAMRLQFSTLEEKVKFSLLVLCKN